MCCVVMPAKAIAAAANAAGFTSNEQVVAFTLGLTAAQNSTNPNGVELT